MAPSRRRCRLPLWVLGLTLLSSLEFVVWSINGRFDKVRRRRTPASLMSTSEGRPRWRSSPIASTFILRRPRSGVSPSLIMILVSHPVRSAAFGAHVPFVFDGACGTISASPPPGVRRRSVVIDSRPRDWVYGAATASPVGRSISALTIGNS